MLRVATMLTALFVASLARADPPDTAAAQALFDEAKKLMGDGRYADACPKLEASQRIDPGPGTLFNLADCYEHVGRLASAWADFLDVAATAKASGRTEHEAVARQRAAALAPRLPRLVVKPPPHPPRGLAIRRGNEDVPEAAWGQSLPVDPGPLELVATAPARAPFHASIVAVEGKELVIAVPDLEPSSAASASTDKPGRGKAQRIAGVAVGVLGLAGVGVGVGFGLASMSARDQAKTYCDAATNICLPAGVPLKSDAIARGNVSTVGFIAGGVALAAGVVLLVTAPSSKASTTALSPFKTGALELSW